MQISPHLCNGGKDALHRRNVVSGPGAKVDGIVLKGIYL
jgi:hypothetical protein